MNILNNKYYDGVSTKVLIEKNNKRTVLYCRVPLQINLTNLIDFNKVPQKLWFLFEPEINYNIKEQYKIISIRVNINEFDFFNNIAKYPIDNIKKIKHIEINFPK